MYERVQNSSQIESRYISVDELTVHVRTAVNKQIKNPKTPTVVLVHGLIVSSLYMVPSILALSPHVQVYSPDLPGFGLSDNPSVVMNVPMLADNLLGCIDALKLNRPVLVGNSLGCQIIADFASRYPDRLTCAVLSGPTMDPHARKRMIQIGRWLRDWPGERPSLAMVQLLNLLEAGFVRSYQTFKYALADPVEEKLPDVNVPTLVVRGSKDPIAPQYWCEEAVSLLPKGKLIVIPGGPHVLNYSVPEEFSKVVLNFINEVQNY